MTRKIFTIPERNGIWIAHNQACWLCRRPVSFEDMQVEHMLPVDLKSRPDELARVLEKFGLEPGFDIESFDNWRPSHADCNSRKTDSGYDAPFIGIEIRRGRERSTKAKEISQKVISDRKLQGAIATILTAVEKGEASWESIGGLNEALSKYQAFYLAEKSEEAEDKLVMSSETIISDGRLRVERQPYGIGVGPADPDVPGHMRCGVCGNLFFNGARCTLCGTLDDD